MGHTYILFLDAYHAGDPLFVAELGRSLTSWSRHGRSGILVNNPAELLSRLVESHGVNLRAGSDALPASFLEQARRTIIESNRKLVAELTEVGLSAVGILGTDRSTIVAEDSADGRGVQAEVRTKWVESIAVPGVFPVLSPIAEVGGVSRPIPVGLVLNGLSDGGRNGIIVFPQKGRMSESNGFETDAIGGSERPRFYDFDEISRISASARLFLSVPKGLKTAEMVGTWISKPNWRQEVA